MKRQTQTLVAGLALAVLAGCAASPSPRFYTLSPTAGSTAAPAKANYTVGVGLVTVPEMVDRPQLVVRIDANRVQLMEQDRWAEPLQGAIGHAIAGNLSRQLQGAWVTAYPQSSTINTDFQVVVNVQRFESAPGTAASVDVLWQVRNAKGTVIKSGRSSVSEPTNGSGNEELVAAHDRALAKVSQDIANVILTAAPGS